MIDSYSPDTSNARTNIDNTEFDFSSIGTQPFLKVLEVYFDNLLAPLFTVHYVNDEGEDSGVMFSEQMSKEHNMDILVGRLMDKLFHPEGHPYSYEPGGLASEIVKDTGRLSELTAYHRKYFHLNNMVSKLKLKHYLN
uniref:Uncharacterized protein n=1 Tax=Meloidogyne incognita TaxID=6306 RepID=A0A914MI78_MELIC